MVAHPFVTLIARGDEYPVATQVPVLITEREGKLFLRGHIMRKTDHHLALEKDGHALVMFTGAHAYISASWYPNPQVASTWNYSAVHAQGQLRFTDEADLLDLLSRLTAHFENNPDSPALMEKMSPEYIQPMLKAIVAFEIAIENIEHVFKLSQNRDKKTYHTIIDHLEEGSTEDKMVAEEMRGLVKN